MAAKQIITLKATAVGFINTAVLVLILLSSQKAFSQEPSANYHPIGKDFIELKNYYLLNLFEEIGSVRILLENDPELSQIAKDKLTALKLSMTVCTDASCFTAKVKFTDEEIAQVSARLTKLYSVNNALGLLVRNHLIPSGAYNLYQKLPPAELLAKAWEQDAQGINHTIAVYADGKKPNYPDIDSIAFNVKDKTYPGLLYNCAETVIAEDKASKLFFKPTLTYALQSLEINERHDATNYEPMATTVNKAAVDRLKTIKWSACKYTLILVPGAGPEEPLVALSAEGMLRCRIAAVSYFDGLAPFIMVSGGDVHPYKTKFCEAEEMKRFLMATLHVPESAILMEPQARHTTTNLRDAARLMFRYGIPANKPGLVATTKSQSFYIGTVMAARCEKELHYVPYKLGARLNDTEQEFYPLIESMQINPLEPLDPK